MIYNIKNNNVRYLMKKNRNPERTKTLKISEKSFSIDILNISKI